MVDSTLTYKADMQLRGQGILEPREVLHLSNGLEPFA